MAVRIHNITFDCADARALAGFWSTLTGWNVYYDDDPEVVLAPSFPYDGTGMLFIPVPEGKTAKNRIHLDLSPGSAPATRRSRRPSPPAPPSSATTATHDGSGWVTLTDPEGNEFCIERGAPERGTPPPRTFKIPV